MSRRELIEDTITDLVADLVYYDRREDEELGIGSIQDAIGAGEVTVSEMTLFFRESLINRLN